MRTESYELLSYLRHKQHDNPAAAHFYDFIMGSKDKDEAADEVRSLMVDTATQAVSLVQDMGLVAHDAFYPEESKRVIDAARRMVGALSEEHAKYLPSKAICADRSLRNAVVEYEENVLDLPQR